MEPESVIAARVLEKLKQIIEQEANPALSKKATQKKIDLMLELLQFYRGQL